MADNNLLLHFNNNIDDSGAGQHIFTASGPGAAPSSVEFKFGGFSEYFDGTAYISAPNSNGDFTFAGDFTFDFWMNTTDSSLDSGFNRVLLSIDPNNSTGLAIAKLTNGKIIVATNLGIYLTSTTSCNDGVWHHVAVTRSGTTLRLFIDGVQEGGTFTLSATITDTVLTLGINTGVAGGHWIDYVDEFHIVNGIAEWTSNFTPPAREYITTPDNANLLLHLDVDYSDATTTSPPTVSGGSFITIDTSVKQFGLGSAHFTPPDSVTAVNIFYSTENANGSHPQYTLDFWLKIPSTITLGTQINIAEFGPGSSQLYLDATGHLKFQDFASGTGFTSRTTSATYNDDTFHHIAITRNSSTIGFYVDGVQQGTRFNSTDGISGLLTIGSLFSSANSITAWFDEVRLLVGTAIWTSTFTPPIRPYKLATEAPVPLDLLLHLNTDYSDATGLNTATVVGGAAISIDSSVKQFGAGSASLQSTNQSVIVALQYPSQAIFDWTGDFTVDCWINAGDGSVNANRHVIWCNGLFGNIEFVIKPTNNPNGPNILQLWSGGSVVIQGTTSFADNTWHHAVVTRSGEITRIFLDGVQEGPTYNVLVPYTGGDFWIGSEQAGGGNPFPLLGHIDEFRLYNGGAVWTASPFSVPTTEYVISSITTTQTILSDADILATTTHTILSDAEVVLVSTQTITSDANISAIRTILSDADIEATTTRTILSDAEVVLVQTKTILSDANISAIRNIFSDADIKATTTRTILSDAKIVLITTHTILSDAEVVKIHAHDITSDAIIASLVNQDIFSQAMVLTALDLDFEVAFTKDSILDRFFQVEVIQAVPGVPFNVTIQNVGNGDNLRIEWDGTATFFNVYRVDPGPVYVKMNPFLIKDHFYVVGGLQENVDYTFVVRGADGQG